MDPHRAHRVAETLREEIEELVNYELDDPRIQSLSVIEVIVTQDMRQARVRLHLEGAPDQQRQTLEAVEGARSYLRRSLRQRLQMYRIPDLHFEASVEIGAGPARLLRRIRKGRPRT